MRSRRLSLFVAPIPLVLLAFASVLLAQTRPEKQITVAPGAKGEIVLHFASPRLGHVIDILVSDPAVHITLVLPDGQELTAQNAKQLQYTWDTEPGDSDAKDFLLNGAGQHVIIGLKKASPGGDYRIRVDAQGVRTETRVAVARIDPAEVIMATQRTIPGAKITKPVKLPAGSTSGQLALTLSQSAGDSILDVAVTNPGVKVSLQLPDGTLVTQATAKAHGIEWTPAKWPPEDEGGDDYGFGLMFMMAMMLPVEGDHQLISFPGTALQSGQHLLRFDAAASRQESEARAMFLPMKGVEKTFEESLHPSPRPGETRVITYADPKQQQKYAGDSVDVTFGLEGEGVREPLQITTQVTFQQRPDQPEQPVSLPVTFARQTNGNYHAAFVLPEGGIYHVATAIQGTQVSGHKFSANAHWDLYSWSLVARLKQLTEHAVDADGNGRPDRLDITAHVDVLTAGKYELSADLEDSRGKGLLQSATAQLERGSQEITVSFPALNLYERTSVDGPYTVTRIVLGLEGDPKSSCCVDGRLVPSYTTTAYRRDDWDRGNFYGTTKLSGSRRGASASGKFQMYRVLWDVMTPGGACSWSGWFSTKDARENPLVQREAKLAPGLSTLEFDLDGAAVQKLGGAHAWKLFVGEVRCDNKPMPTTNRYSELFDFDTEVLRAEDFEPIPPDFQLEPPATELALRAGGPQVFFDVNVKPTGQLAAPVTFRVVDLPEGVRGEANNAPNRFVWGSTRITLFARDTARPGTYPVRVVGTDAGKEHQFALRLVIEAAPPAAKPSRSASAAGRRSVMLLLGTHAGMSPAGCEIMKEVARTFPKGLESGRDTLGIMTVGGPVNVVLPLTADFGQTYLQSLDSLLTVQCTGTLNAVYALEKAEEQLQQPQARDSQRIVILVAGGLPSAITAKWPIRTQADSRRAYLDGKEVALPPSGCADLRVRFEGEAGLANGDSVPDRIGVLALLFAPMSPLLPPDGPMPPLPRQPINPSGTCGFTGPPFRSLVQDVAYLPETDIGGVPLDGPRRLERFESGPYQGKIRPDSTANSQAALQNAFENVVHRLNGKGIGVFFLSASPYGSPPADLNSALNVPGSVGYDASRCAGFVLAIHDTEQLPRALNETWAALGRTPKRSK